MMNREELASISKLEEAQLSRLCSGNDEKIGNLRSIGVAEPFRSNGLSIKLIQFSLAQLASLGANVAVGICWKHGDEVAKDDACLRNPIFARRSPGLVRH